MNAPDPPSANRRRLAAHLLGSLLAAAAVAGAIFALVPPEYEAYATIRVAQPVAGPFATSPPADVLGVESAVETEMEMLASAPVLDAALADRSVSKLPFVSESASPRERLRAGLKIVNLRKTLLIRVSYAAPSPEEAAAVVNAVVASYMEWASIHVIGNDQVFIRELSKYADGLRAAIRQETDRLDGGFPPSPPPGVVSADDPSPIPVVSPTGDVAGSTAAIRPAVVSPEEPSPLSFTSLTEDLARSTAERLVQVDLDLARERDPEKAADLKKTQSGLRRLLALPVASRDEAKAQQIRRRIDDLSRMEVEVFRKLEDAKFLSDRSFARATQEHNAAVPKAPSRDLRGPLMAASTVSILLVGLALGLQPGRARATVRTDAG